MENEDRHRFKLRRNYLVKDANRDQRNGWINDVFSKSSWTWLKLHPLECLMHEGGEHNACIERHNPGPSNRTCLLEWRLCAKDPNQSTRSIDSNRNTKTALGFARKPKGEPQSLVCPTFPWQFIFYWCGWGVVTRLDCLVSILFLHTCFFWKFSLHSRQPSLFNTRPMDHTITIPFLW
jgi:hypothetical protein